MINRINEMLTSVLKNVETLSEKLIPEAVTSFHAFILLGANIKAKKHQTSVTKVATWICEEISSNDVNNRIIISYQYKDQELHRYECLHRSEQATLSGQKPIHTYHKSQVSSNDVHLLHLSHRRQFRARQHEFGQ